MDQPPAPHPEPPSPRLLTLLLAYGLVALVFAGELLLPGRSLFRWDTLIYNWPLVAEARSQLLAGHWPFWTTSICAGTPLLENINAGVLYPLKLLLYLLPLRTGGHLFLFVHVWWSFVAMHLFVQRGLRLRPLAAVVAALAFGASGYARGMWDTHNFVSLPWIPLALWAVSAPLTPRARIAAGAGIWAMLLYGGDLQQSILTVPVAALLLVVRRSGWRESACAGAGLGLGLLLAAPQWWPAMEWAAHSYRAGGLALADAAERSFHPARLVELISPHTYGTRDGWRGLHLAWGQKGAPWCSSFHIGLVPLLCVFFAVRARRREPVWAALLTLGGLAIAFGGFAPWFALWQKLPLVGSFRYPEKYLLWSTLGLAVLAGFGTAPALDALARFFRRPVLPLAAAAFLSVLIPWFAERPTTGRFEPLDTPALLQPIRNSDRPEGRVLVDPALTDVPLPSYFQGLRASEKQAVYYREKLDFNGPRLFGCQTVSGFSPAESGAVRHLREDDGTNAAAVAAYARNAGAYWLVTTPARRLVLEEAGLQCASEVTYGTPPAIEVCRITNVPLAVIADSADGFVTRVWKPRPGVIRVDCSQGGSGTVHVTESWAPGWRAVDQNGAALAVTSAEGFIAIARNPDTMQVRLAYTPPAWRASLLLALLGAVGLVAVWRPLRPGAPVLSAVLFVVLSLAARAHWSPTFDEGFHLVRGLALRHFHDSRLSFFHPPLQNAAGAYVADLAFGDRLRLPKTPSWKMADSSGYAVDLATANAAIFPDLVQASRWSATLFGVLLVLTGTWWARRWGGAHAGWLCGLALALNPNLLAHGSLNTTDIGVTALAFAGLACLWHAQRSRSTLALTSAALLFVLAGLAKFTGLIWLFAFLLVALPLLCNREFARRRLWLIPVTLLLLGGAILWLYGGEAQAVRQVRADGRGIEEIAKLPAGRFVEGILAQSRHALEGHKAWFHGRGFERSSWWHMPAAILLKSPWVWTAGLLLAGALAVRRRALSDRRWIVWVPAFAFVVLLFFVNRMAIGIRHALPLLALGTLAGAVAIVRLPSRWNRLASLLWVAGFAAAALLSYPRFIGYFPLPLGGVQEGHRWMVDSNHDWGQELPDLEAHWARLTLANGGRPPALVYFGFGDPRALYALEVSADSYCGFAMSVAGNVPAAVGTNEGLIVASVSALALEPHGLRTAGLLSLPEQARVGAVWKVLRRSGKEP